MINVFQSASGIKFVAVGAHGVALGALCTTLYQVYADYAMKNPFYTPEMPLRADLFDAHVALAVAAVAS